MPHAGHFICGDKCRFHLNTYVGGHVVSTLGELWSERSSREIHAKVFDPRWFEQNRQLKGYYFDNVYMKKFGFETIGLNRLYETMVFKAKKTKNKCCPYSKVSDSELDFEGYNDVGKAVKGHMKYCKKWSKK